MGRGSAEVSFQASVDAPVGAICAFGGSGDGVDQVKEIILIVKEIARKSTQLREN